jgi:CubicO group peptidase (beta-lactamase class C family)
LTDKSLPRADPSAVGVDAAGVIAFLDAVQAAPDIELHSLMLVRHGQVFAEGWWHPFSAGRVHLLYSLSKSFTSTAVGLAVAEGLVDLDATVLSYFPELDADITDPRSRAMLVRHIASMSSGHREDTIARAQALDPCDLVRGFLLMPPDEEPGSFFAYNQSCTFTLAAIVQRVSGTSLTGYLRPRLFDPLGIGPTGWIRDASGREIGYSGMHADTEAVAALGQLYLQAGRWGERQLLTTDWVAQASRRQVGTELEANIDWAQGYGYQFWMARHGYRGDGAFGQFCVILPEHDAVVAITAQTEDMQGVLELAWRLLLPAIIGPGSAAADAALAERLPALRLPALPGSPAPTDEVRQTFTAAHGNDQPGLTDVVLSPGPDGKWTVALVEGDAPVVAQLGIGEWAVTDVVATSGGWTTSGDPEQSVIAIDVLFIETPHRLQLRCHPTTGTFDCRWMTMPLHSPRLIDLRMPGSG